MFAWFLRRVFAPFGSSGAVSTGGGVCATADGAGRVSAAAGGAPRVTATAGAEAC